MANDLPPTLILAIPGTQETKEIPREEVIEAIRKGEIPQDNWVWSPSHNDWKQVSELPELNLPATPSTPASTLMPDPPARAAVFMDGKVPGGGIIIPKTAVAATPVKVATPVAQKVVAQPHQVSVAPRAAVAAAAPAPSANAAAKTRFSQKMEVKDEFPIFKVLFFIIFLIVGGILAGNYLYVDQPFTNNISVTPYAAVQPYAHLGAFVQPGALVIHIPPTNVLNAGNMANFLATLARNTPPRPFSSSPFDGVGLTAAWQSQFLFNGADWQTLGEMSKVTAEERRKFELEHLQFVDGSPLLKVKKDEDPDALKAAEDKAWQTFVENFIPKS
jgi:hypothetical protein